MAVETSRYINLQRKRKESLPEMHSIIGEKTQRCNKCDNYGIDGSVRLVIVRLSASFCNRSLQLGTTKCFLGISFFACSTKEEEDNHFSWVWCLGCDGQSLDLPPPTASGDPKTESDIQKKLVDVVMETWEEIWACLFSDNSWVDQCRVGLNGVSSGWQASIGRTQIKKWNQNHKGYMQWLFPEESGVVFLPFISKKLVWGSRY